MICVCGASAQAGALRTATHFSVFTAAFACVSRYHSNVRANPSSNDTCGE